MRDKQLIDDNLKKMAKENPNGWVYKIKEGVNIEGQIAPTAVMGAWKVDENGNIIGEFIENPNYDPEA